MVVLLISIVSEKSLDKGHWIFKS